MIHRILFSIIESPLHPDFTALYQHYGYEVVSFTSERKAIQALKQTPPQVVVADFVYGYGNNYAGVNISNLDVFLHSLEKYAPEAIVIVLADKGERQYVDKLNDIMPLAAVLTYPVDQERMAGVLQCL